MGKNAFLILLLNDDNKIGEHKETRIERPNMCPFEKKKIFRPTTFFSGTNCFLCIVNKKKFWSGL